MKKLLLAALIFTSSVPVFAQGQQLSPKAVAKGDNIEVDYGQPSKRNRVIFGDLVPYNEVWRTGANEATEIKFKKNMNFGGQPVKAGTYTLFSIPTEKEWTIILNSQLGQWGAFDYEKNKSKNVLQIKVPVRHLNNVQEQLTYTVNKDALLIEWDQTGVSIPVD